MPIIRSMPLLVDAIRTGNTDSDDIEDNVAKGLLVFFNITAVPTIDTVTLVIQGKRQSGTYFDILTGSAEVAVAEKEYRLYPGIVENANVSVDQILPLIWRVQIQHSAGGNFNYTVDAIPII